MAEEPDLDQQGLWGCFGQCDFECRDKGCDWTCPNNQEVWLSRWREVGGVFNTAVGEIKEAGPAQLPLYLPVIRHGKRRQRHVNAEVVALSLYEVIRGRRGGGYGRSLPGAAALREEFKLRADCRVLLVSVGADEWLERFWQRYRADDIPQALFELDLIGMTAPNFSFFTDAPRTHSIWNRMRMLRVAERLSEAGVAVILHLNAFNQRDWNYWAAFLRERSNLRYVAKEFQTGLARRKAGIRAFHALADLQQQVGRALHPLLIGGARFLPLLNRHFPGCGTVVDSRPFMNTIKRRFASVSPTNSKLGWHKCRTALGGRLDALLDYNLACYRSWAASAARREFK